MHELYELKLIFSRVFQAYPMFWSIESLQVFLNPMAWNIY